MATYYSNVIIISLLVSMLFISTIQSSSIGDLNFVNVDFDIDELMDHSTTSSSCTGTVGECFAGDDEFQVDSESNRRILRGRRYISYGALRRNYVPCSRRGASYYNCRPGASANPYRRGCSRIARCRR